MASSQLNNYNSIGGQGSINGRGSSLQPIKGIQRDNLNQSVIESYGQSRNLAGMNQIGDRASTISKTTDDLMHGQFSKSIQGPTNYTSQMSHNIQSYDNSQLQLPNIGLSRQNNQGATDLHQVLTYGPLAKQFVKTNKKAIQKFLRSEMKNMEPFKGYVEISNASQHLKKHQNQGMEHSMMIEPSIEDQNISNAHYRAGTPEPPGQRGGRGGRSMGPNPAAMGINSKVMETWINETLADAEHLDIPGVILKPEHKNPISRYAIDRLTLTNAGIPNDTVDRIYRALFVYSVGFYEVIKKIISHCQRKYSIITAIWKVFAVLLEYCCQSDYRMLISEITNQHKEEKEKMEIDFQQKCQEFLNNEKIMKQNMEVLQKYSEELEKERTNERTLRLKLEEEYMQNSKNHEEEVQLRLKFESKLNSMHSIHRELEIKHKRMMSELANSTMTISRHEKLIDEQSLEIMQLKTLKAEHMAKIELLEEKKATLDREIGLKNSLVKEVEDKMRKTQDESDLLKYKIHEQSKEMTEFRLKIDCLDTKIEGLQNEKRHLEISLTETKEFKQIFEDKNQEIKESYASLILQFNENKEKLIGFEELYKDMELKVQSQKAQIEDLQNQIQALDQENGTLKIELEKVTNYYRNTKNDLDDTIDRLHQTNRVRHELELRLMAEKESNEKLTETLDEKLQVIASKERKIEEFEYKCREFEFKVQDLEGQLESLQKKYEMKVAQMNEKVDALNEIIHNERETREIWADRYEKEQKEHTVANTELLILKSKIKDLELDLGNMHIKHESQVQANNAILDNNVRLQKQLNEKLVALENTMRDNTTLRETFKQVDQQKREYSQKIFDEMDKSKTGYATQECQASMLMEDCRSRAVELFRELQTTKLDLTWTREELKEANTLIKYLQKEEERNEMIKEDLYAQVNNQSHTIFTLKNDLMISLDQTEKEKYESEQQRISFEQTLKDLEAQRLVIQMNQEKDLEEWDQAKQQLLADLNEIKIRNTDTVQRLNSMKTQYEKAAAALAAATNQKQVIIQTQDQESQTIPVKQPVVKEIKRVPADDDSSEVPTPNTNKLVSQANKRRDSMNRQLKLKEQNEQDVQQPEIKKQKTQVGPQQRYPKQENNGQREAAQKSLNQNSSQESLKNTNSRQTLTNKSSQQVLSLANSISQINLQQFMNNKFTIEEEDNYEGARNNSNSQKDLNGSAIHRALSKKFSVQRISYGSSISPDRNKSNSQSQIFEDVGHQDINIQSETKGGLKRNSALIIDPNQSNMRDVPSTNNNNNNDGTRDLAGQQIKNQNYGRQATLKSNTKKETIQQNDYRSGPNQQSDKKQLNRDLAQNDQQPYNQQRQDQYSSIQVKQNNTDGDKNNSSGDNNLPLMNQNLNTHLTNQEENKQAPINNNVSKMEQVHNRQDYYQTHQQQNTQSRNMMIETRTSDQNIGLSVQQNTQAQYISQQQQQQQRSVMDQPIIQHQSSQMSNDTLTSNPDIGSQGHLQLSAASIGGNGGRNLNNSLIQANSAAANGSSSNTQQSKLKDRKVTGKTSIKTMIRAAATRD